MITIERMIDEVILKFGHEDIRTLNFCWLCEDATSTIEEIQEEFDWLMND